MSEHTPEQIASAYATLDLALKHSNALNMGTWVSIAEEGVGYIDLEELKAECGTTACFAGWHVARLGYALDEDGDVRMPDGSGYRRAGHIAAEDLGLTPEAADHLFLSTATWNLEDSILDEFGPRPDPA